MDRQAVVDTFRQSGALLEGHFVLSSGLHSPLYLQCARVLMNPRRAAELCRALAAKIERQMGAGAIDVVVSPAMGGVVVGYEMARQLDVDSLFTERVDGSFVLRRGFELAPDCRVLMAEDVITTGKSSRECIDCIETYGGKVVAASCLVDRSDGAVDFGVPCFSLLAMEVPAYAPDDLPPELAAIAPVKPGSRGLQ